MGSNPTLPAIQIQRECEMATAQNIVDKLVEKTESGEIKWEIHSSLPIYWVTTNTGGDCAYQLVDGGTLLFHFQHKGKSDVQDIAELQDTTKLLAVLNERYPSDEISRDDVLQIAYECLQ